MATLHTRQRYRAGWLCRNEEESLDRDLKLTLRVPATIHPSQLQYHPTKPKLSETNGSDSTIDPLAPQASTTSTSDTSTSGGGSGSGSDTARRSNSVPTVTAAGEIHSQGDPQISSSFHLSLSSTSITPILPPSTTRGDSSSEDTGRLLIIERGSTTPIASSSTSAATSSNPTRRRRRTATHRLRDEEDEESTDEQQQRSPKRRRLDYL